MLKERLLTALLAGAALLAGLWFLDTAGVGVLLGVVTLLAAYEWSGLTTRRPAARFAFPVVAALFGWASLCYRFRR